MKKFLLVLFLMWCMIPYSANAEETISHCYPTKEQIEAYKKDGTWEERQKYVEKLNYDSPSQALLYSALQREQGIAMYNLVDEMKGMATTGTVKMLLVRVEFADMTFENSKIYSEEEFLGMAMGKEGMGEYPYESQNAFYKRSSYGELDIVADKVYSCTVSKDREMYSADEGALVKEVLEKLDGDIDFAEYDENKDGVIDSLCINFAGEDTGWGSTWWSHKADFADDEFKVDGVSLKGYIFLESDVDAYGLRTMIHETGHLLGLPDYYCNEGEGIATPDMMNHNSGDHNGFSKWLLGWIKEDNVLRLNKESGSTEVSLVPLSSESIKENEKVIAVIAPEDTSIYSEYFVVQYDEPIGNQSTVIDSPRYRVYHLDAHLNEEGTYFENSNMAMYGRPLIKVVSVREDGIQMQDHYAEGDALTPDTNESTAFYGGSIFGFTGIELTEFKTGESPSFQLSFREKEAVDGKLTLQLVGEAPLNNGGMTLLSNKPLYYVYSELEAYLEDGEGKQYPLNTYVEDGSELIEMVYLNASKPLKPETEYTLVIPAGLFQIDKDVYSEECRLEVKTGKFPETEKIEWHEYGITSDVFHIDDTKAGFFQIVNYEDWGADLYVYEGAEQTEKIYVEFPIQEPYTNLHEIKAIACYDGNLAVEIHSSTEDWSEWIYQYYKIAPNGKVLAGPYNVTEKLRVFPLGNGLKGISASAGGGALGAPDIANESKLEVYTIDFQEEITSQLINANRSGMAAALDQESYIVYYFGDEGYMAGIFNSKDEEITTIDLSDDINCGRIGCAVKAGDDIAILYTHFGDEKNSIVVSRFAMDGTHLETKEIFSYEGWKDSEGWMIERTSWGYSLSNETEFDAHMFYLLNKDFELISSVQILGYEGSGTHMGERVLLKWSDNMTYQNQVTITKPIVEEGAVVDPDKPEEDDKVNPKPDNPSEGEEAGKKPVPDTGDTSKAGMFLAMMIVAGVIVGVLKPVRYRSKR